MPWPSLDPPELVKLRVKGDLWCQLVISLKPSFTICGRAGVIFKRRELVREDEIYMLNWRGVFTLDSAGQITEQLREFFPECIPHLKWHLQHGVPPETIEWAKKFCLEDTSAIRRWRYAASEYQDRRFPCDL